MFLAAPSAVLIATFVASVLLARLIPVVHFAERTTVICVARVRLMRVHPFLVGEKFAAVMALVFVLPVACARISPERKHCAQRNTQSLWAAMLLYVFSQSTQ